MHQTLLAPFNVTNPEFYLIELAAHAVPWSRAAFESCQAESYRNQGLWVSGAPVGYTLCQVIAEEVTLMNIAVDPKYQGQGFGALLIKDIIAFACNQHGEQIYPIFLEVRQSNHQAIRLYEKHGFTEVGRRPGYYPPISPKSEKETAIVMRR